MISESCVLFRRRRHLRIIQPFLAVTLLGGLFCTGAAAAEVAAEALPPASTRPVDFEKEVQPLLKDHCYSCHGPEKQKGDLRWDTKASVFKAGDHGPILKPNDSAGSRVIRMVAGLEPDAIMPPRGERLTPVQIGLLRGWIDQGAPWPELLAGNAPEKRNHWAFKPPTRPAIPVVQPQKWIRNPIDAFVLAKLEQEKLKPSPESERTTLIRRLSLDLTGLPPSLKEVDQFLADREAGAYERLVERLLASPHYGERWGRHWLDLARYADTNGYEKDRARSIWPYRDWVIGAFNRDLPYDQFVIEQLAGDLLPNPSREQKVATGFLRNAMLNQEGGIEPEQFRVEALIDRMDTIGKALLGLTINCCQCHDHKFDPFSQREYYQLFAFLNNDDEAFLEVPTPEEQKHRDNIRSKVRALEEGAMAEATNLAQRVSSWEKSFAGNEVNWNLLDPADWHNFATKYEKQEDLSLLGGGDIQPGGTMRVWIDTKLTNITAFRLEALTNNNLVYGGPGIVGHGSFLVKEFTVEAWASENPTVTNKVKFRRALADAEAPGFGVTNAIDGNSESGGWAPSATPEHRNQNHWAVFECAEPIGFPGGTKLLVTLLQGFDDQTKLDCHMLGCFRLAATTDSVPRALPPFTLAQRQWLSTPFENRSAEQKLESFNLFRLADASFTETNKKIDEAWSSWPYPPTTMVLAERPRARTTRIFKRGDRLRPGEEVKPDVPAILNPVAAGCPRTRLGLAQWVVDPASPTTARAMVNRIWMEYFGQGLVSTPEDFGTRAGVPSHPELLDWLACEFMHPTVRAGQEIAGGTPAQPWSIKHIQRLILTSATYRQSSRVTPEVYAKDQYDRFLERAPRLRVEGEMVQDIALAVSGLLSPKLGGPSVFPPIPPSVGDTSYAGFNWPETKGEDRFRRGMYTFWKRSLPFPALTSFDVPSGETSCPRRVRSDTPLQALTTLNEKTFVEAAQALALRVMKEGGNDDRSRVRYAFRLCTARQPERDELDKLHRFWLDQYRYFENRTADAVKVAVPDLTNMPPELNLHKVAAWTMVSRAILNLDETITKE